MAKGYSFAALVDVLYPVYKTSLGNGVNLNDFNSLDHVGVYVQEANVNALGGSNYPSPNAGCLEVLPNAGGVIQRYTVYTGENATFVRSCYTGTWSAWKRYLTDNIIYNAVYPVGICIQFDANVNPNTTFPGTTWAQIVDGRQVRAAENAAAIGTTGGADSATLTTAMMPVHSHSIAQHTHTVAAHNHSMATHTHTLAAHTHGIAQHTHNVGSHKHSMTHAHTASAAANGAHTHLIANGATQTGTGDSITLNGSNYLMGAFGPTGFGYTEYALKGGTQAPDRGVTNSAGSHAHTITVSTLTDDTGLAGAVTDTAGATATAANAAQTTAAGGATATGDNSTQTTSTSGATATGNAGGTTVVPTAGTWHKYAIWKRTA